MKVGLIGGTFNPIHYGHLRTAEEIRQIFSLERVIFIPSAHPPHKPISDVSNPEHRLEMTRLAIAGNPGFSVSDIELKRSGKSYTIDTILHFRDEIAEPDPKGLYFISGMDAFQEIATWKEYKKLFSLCHFVVMTRPGCPPPDLKEALPAALARQFTAEPYGRYMEHESGFRIYFQEVTALDISGSGIRRLIREGGSIRYLTPKEVEAFIERNHLYQEADNQKEN